jgi:hypothetical protein
MWMAAAELLKPSQAGVDEDFVNEVCHSWSWHQLERLMCRVTRPFLATALPPTGGWFLSVLHPRTLLLFLWKKRRPISLKKRRQNLVYHCCFFFLVDMTYCCMPIPVLF